MKRILILIIGLFSVAHAQFAPTSAKTAFKNGVSVGTRDSTAYAANDSLVVVINRQGRLMYRSTDGYWKLLANAASSDYVPYTGAVDNVALGNFRITARSVKTDSIYANGSGGMYLLTNSGNPVAHWGAGGSVEVDFKGFAGYDANRSASYTARSFTDKNYVDSSAALRVRYADTAAMLADYVDLGSTQTIAGLKTFTGTVNSGGTNFITGGAVWANGNLESITGSIGFGNSTRLRLAQLDAIAGFAGGNNIYFNSGSPNIPRAASNGTVAGYYYSGGGSVNLYANTILYGESVLSPRVRIDSSDGAFRVFSTTASSSTTTGALIVSGGAGIAGQLTANTIVKSGGTSSQFLKADGSVDGTSYATAASLSGYMDLSTNQTAAGNKTFTGFIQLNGQQYIYLGNSGNTLFPYIRNTGGDGIGIYNNAGSALLLANTSTGISTNGRDFAAGATTLTGALNGTSLSMSGGAALATSSGDVLIAGATTDGTNKLIVNGGVKGTSIAAETAEFTKSASAADGGLVFIKNSATAAIGNKSVLAFGANSGQGSTNGARIQEITTDAGNGASSLEFYVHAGAGSSTKVLTLASNQSATFSSSVTATSFIKSGGTSSQSLMADGSVQTVMSATYNPTLSGVTNINSITLDKASYIRVGAIITVYVSGTVSTTAAGGSAFSITAPLQPIGSSVIGNGTVNNGTSDGASGYVSPSSTSVVQFNWNSINTTSRTFSLSFQYSL